MKSPAERPSGSSPRTLPEGWRWVKLGDACRQDRQIVEPSTGEADSLTYYSLEHIESETGRILKAPIEQVEDEGKSTTFRFDKRHVLYGKLRPYLNKVALPDAAGRCTTEMIPLLPGDGIDRVFLAWILRRGETVEFAMHGKTGSRMPRADMSNLLTLELSLPPLPEQQRIAAILREQMAAVEKARAAAQARLEAVKALPAAFLRQVFPQPGQRLPDGWRWVKLEEVCDGAGQYGTSTKSSSDQRGVPVLGMYHIHEGRIRWQNVSYVELKAEELPKYLLRKGDLLFNRTNSAALVGKTAVYDTDKAAVFASYLIRFPLVEEIADSHFLSAFINSREGRRFIEANMAQAIGQVNISASTMRTMPVPLPPLHEQQRIAGMLREQMAAVEKARAAAEAELDTINALPAALLRRAFNGEI